MKAIYRRTRHLERFSHPRTGKIYFKELPEDLEALVTPDILDIIVDKYLEDGVLKRVQLFTWEMCRNPNWGWRLGDKDAREFAIDMAMEAYDYLAHKKRQKVLSEVWSYKKLRGYLSALSGGKLAKYAVTDVCINEWRTLVYQRDGRVPARISRDNARLWRQNGHTNAEKTKEELIRMGYSERDAENLKAPPVFESPHTLMDEDGNEISMFELKDVVEAMTNLGEYRDNMAYEDRISEDIADWLKQLIKAFVSYDFVKFELERQLDLRREKAKTETDGEKSDKLLDTIRIEELELEFLEIAADGSKPSRLPFLRERGFNDVDERNQKMINASNAILRKDRPRFVDLRTALLTRPLAETFSAYGTSVAIVGGRIGLPEHHLEALERVVPQEVLS